MRITIAIPCFNHRQYISAAIKSCLDQGWANLDLLIIDDGSTDGSVEVIKALLDSYGGFRFVSRENRGLIATLNQLLQMAEGDAFCLLASDDYLPSQSISLRANFLNERPEHVCVFGDGLIVGEGPAKVFLSEKQRRLFTLSDPIPEFLNGTNLPIHTMMVRTEVFRSIGGFDLRYRRCEDLDVQLLLFLQGKVGFVDSPVYCYREHAANTSRVNRQIARVDKVLCYLKYLDEVPLLNPYRSLIRYRLRRQYLLLARHLRQTGGGSAFERNLLANAWGMAWRDPRLLWNLLCLNLIKGRMS